MDDGNPGAAPLIRRLIRDAGRQQVVSLVGLAGVSSLLDVSGIGLGVGLLVGGEEPLRQDGLALFFAVVIGRAGVQAFTTIGRQQLLTRFTDRLRLELLERVLGASGARLQQVGRGELLGLLMSDVDRTSFALHQGIAVLQGVLAMTIYVASVLAVGRDGAVPLLLGLAATSLAALLQRSDAEQLGELYTRLNAALHRTVGDGLHGLKAVRAAGAEGWWLRRYGQDTGRFRRLLLEITRRQAVFGALRDVLAVLVVGLWLLLFRGNLGREAIVTTLLLTYRAAGSASAVIQARRNFLGDLPGYGELCRIRTELGEPRRISSPDAGTAGPVPTLPFRLAVRADAGRGAVHELLLRSGSLTAVVGPSGAGKTTLLDAFSALLVGHASCWELAPAYGEPMLWSSASADDWRRRVAYAPQETVLFEGSLRDNLLLGHQAAASGSDTEIRRWLMALGLQELLERPGGLDAELHLSMDCYSGGEIRRLGLARAWLLDRPIEVVDEPTASLDADSAERVRTILRQRARRRAVLVATHDNLLISSCDQVIHLDAGKTNAMELRQKAT